MRGWAGTIFVAALVAACMPSRVQVARGPWHALDTPHVQLETDLPLDVAAARSSVFEREVQQLRNLYTLLGARRPAPDLVRVVLFADCDASARFRFGQRMINLLSSELDDVPTIASCEGRSRYAGAQFRWGLAYRVTRRALGALPDWLEAGVIEYVAGVHRDGDVLELGHPRPGWSVDDDRSFDEARRSPWRWTWGASWKVVHAMLNTSATSREHALAFLTALGDGVPEDEAWARTMGEVDAAIRSTYARWRPTSFKAWKLWAAEEQEFTPTIRSLSTTEVLARFVDIAQPNMEAGFLGQGVAGAWNTLRRVDATGDTALYWRAIVAYRTRSHGAGNARALFASYVEKRPDDPRGHLGLLLAGLDELAADPQQLLEAEASVQKAVGIATSANALEGLGRYWRLRGKPEAARPFLDRALERDRACARCYDTLAGVLFDQGDVTGAVAAEERAIASSGEDGPTPEMSAGLARYRSALQAVR